LVQSHPFKFRPTLTGLEKDKISLRLYFEDPSKLKTSGQASFRIRMKEPSLIRTELTMSPLIRE